jgi:hypothetical protein
MYATLFVETLRWPVLVIAILAAVMGVRQLLLEPFQSSSSGSDGVASTATNGKLIVILVCIVPKFVLFQKLAHSPTI